MKTDSELHHFAERLLEHVSEAHALANEADDLMQELRGHGEAHEWERLRFSGKRYVDEAGRWAHDLNDALTYLLLRSAHFANPRARRDRG